MSVIVKGMEMPQNCFACACASYYGRIDRAMCDLTNKQLDIKTWKKERHPNCPLIELPPHGRLIDADELIDGCEKLMRMLDPEGKEYLRVFAIKSYLMWAAEYAIIEAEGSET